jgi:hypothetical protein
MLVRQHFAGTTTGDNARQMCDEDRVSVVSLAFDLEYLPLVKET